jgi:hypothetical protein
LLTECRYYSNYTSKSGLRLGGDEARDSDELLQEAVDLAKDADGVIAIIGLVGRWWDTIVKL